MASIINALKPHFFLSERAIALPEEGMQIVGLLNKNGTDCFLNAVRQFAYNTAIKYVILHRPSSIPHSVYDDFQQYQRTRGGLMGGSDVLRHQLLPDSMQGGHQSAHEALMKIIEKMPNSWRAPVGNGSLKNPLFSSIEHLRDGVTCAVSLEAPLILPIKREKESPVVMRSMQEVWDHYTAVKDVEGVMHQYRFASLPDHLLFSLVRNSENGAKINDFIEPTFRLDDQHVSTLRPQERADFHIQAFIVHQGEETHGHYYTYVYVKDRWFKCDDARVVPLLSKEVVKEEMGRASIFYARRRGITDQQVEDTFSPHRLPERSVCSLIGESEITNPDFSNTDFAIPEEMLVLDEIVRDARAFISEREIQDTVSPSTSAEHIAASSAPKKLWRLQEQEHVDVPLSGRAVEKMKTEQKPIRMWKTTTILYAIGYYALYLPLYHIAQALNAVFFFVLKLFYCLA